VDQSEGFKNIVSEVFDKESPRLKSIIKINKTTSKNEPIPSITNQIDDHDANNDHSDMDDSDHANNNNTTEDYVTLRTMKDEQHHISLSKTFPLRFLHIDSFIDLLKTTLEYKTSFEIDMCDYEYFINEEKTRSFIALKIYRGWDQICDLISSTDTVLKQFKQPTFYKDPKPHITVGWTVGNILPDLLETEKINNPVITPPPIHHHHDLNSKNQHQGDYYITSGMYTMKVTKVQCKVGNRIYTFPLK